MAAVLLSVGEGSSKASSSSNPDEILFYGIVPVLVASVLSGLASALCQWASQVSKHCYFMKGFFIFSPFWYACHLLQVKKHSSYLMTVEMSIIGSFCLISSTSKSPDGEAIRQHGFFYGWTALTLVNQLCQYAFFFYIWYHGTLLNWFCEHLKRPETGATMNMKASWKKFLPSYLGIFSRRVVVCILFIWLDPTNTFNLYCWG